MGIVIVVLQMLLAKNFDVAGSLLGRIAALAVLVIAGLARLSRRIAGVRRGASSGSSSPPSARL